MQNRSISQRLKKAAVLSTKREIALDWAAAWKREQEDLVRQLGKAVASDDFDQLCRIAGQIKAVTEKKLESLPNVINALTGETEVKIEVTR